MDPIINHHRKVRFLINEDIFRKRFRIRWTEDGKEKEKQFSYLKVERKDAMARATEYQQMLNAKFML